MRTSLDAYGANVFFSYMKGSNVLKIDYSEYKSIKYGGYKKLLTKYFDTYDSDGKIHKNTTGLLFDQLI